MELDTLIFQEIKRYNLFNNIRKVIKDIIKDALNNMNRKDIERTYRSAYKKNKSTIDIIFSEIYKSIISFIIREKSYDDEMEDPLVPNFRNLMLNGIEYDNVAKLLSELNNKTPNEETSSKIIESMREICLKWLESNSANHIYPNININVIYGDIPSILRKRDILYVDIGHLAFETIEFEIPQDVETKLYESLIASTSSNEDDIYKIMFITLLRYKSLHERGPSAMQFAVTSEQMDEIRINFGVDVELFASPFNRDRNNYFCGLFPDIEQLYDGNLGSYRDFLYNSPSGTIECNPPFIELIQDNVIKEILSVLESEEMPLGVFCVFAAWNDSEYYKLIESSKYLITNIVKLKNPFYLNIDDMRMDEPIFYVNIFMLANNKYLSEYNNRENLLEKFNEIVNL